MQSFSRGWSFLMQTWQMAFKDCDLPKSSIYALEAGFALSLFGLVPVVGVYLLLGTSSIGLEVTFLVGVLMVFVNFLVTYVFSAMTAYLIYAYLSEGDRRMDKAWAIVKRDFFDAFALIASLINTYSGIAYHTWLYIGGCEKVQVAGQPVRVVAPAPLAAVWG